MRSSRVTQMMPRTLSEPGVITTGCASVLSPEAARELGRLRSRRPTCAAAGQAHAFFALVLGSRRRCATVARQSMAVRSGFRRWERRAFCPPLSCLIPHRCWRFGLSAEGEGFEPPRDLTAPCDFRDSSSLAQPCALTPSARHNARQFGEDGGELAELRSPRSSGRREATSRDWGTSVRLRQQLGLCRTWSLNCERLGADAVVRPRSTPPRPDKSLPRSHLGCLTERDYGAASVRQ
jgi:hypothetical protein